MTIEKNSLRENLNSPTEAEYLKKSCNKPDTKTKKKWETPKLYKLALPKKR